LILTVKWAEIESVSNYISFASTIASLLLAVVAIVYSFLSNNSFTSSVSKIEVAADSVREETEKLNITIKAFDGVMRQIPESIKSVESRLAETNDAIKASAQRPETGIHPEKEWSLKIMNFFLSGSSWNGLKSIYICKLSFDKKRKFNLKLICDDQKTLSHDYAYAYIVASTSIGFFSHNIDNELFEITTFMSELGPALDERISFVCSEGKVAPKKVLEDEISRIKQAFEPV